MADERQPSIPLPGDGARAATRTGATSEARERASMGAVIGALVVGLVLGVIGIKLLDGIGGDEDPFAGAIDSDRYQAVILSNDKVYFGRIDDVSDSFFELEDAFFLRETRESADAEPVRSLLPINAELHAPENKMLIRKDEVVLVENLADDSPLLTEIKRQTGDD